MKNLISLLLVLLTSNLFSQGKSTLSGYITDVKSGEAIIGAKISIPSLKQGTITNTYGFYSLTVEKGNYVVEFSALGQKTESRNIDLTNDVTLGLEMGVALSELQEVTVNAKKGENVNSTKIGQIELDVEKIKTLPAFMGEVDIVKTIQLLPGVSSVSEGGQGFYVRGGGPDQNLVLLDEGVVYNAAHLFGFFSVFNADAVKSVNLIKGECLPILVEEFHQYLR